MNRKTVFVSTILAALLAVCFLPEPFQPAVSETVTLRASSVSIDTEGLYNRMIQLFRIGDKKRDYANAMAVYEDYPQLKGYSDAEKYYRYMSAWKDLQSGDMTKSGLLFRSLGDFLDSMACYAYTAGRTAENEGRYADAISLYIEASSANILDWQTRLLDCSTHIDEEIKRTKYSDAVNDYSRAEAGGDAEKMDAVKKVFASLGDYQDAKTYLAKCEAWLRAFNRRISVSASADGNTLTVSWTDNDQGHTYILSYRPENCQHWDEMMLNASPAALPDLIPNTVYQIAIRDAETPSVSASAAVKTNSAEKISDDQVKLSKVEIVGLPRDDTWKTFLTPEQVVNDYPNLLSRKENNVFLNADLADYVLYGSVICRNMTEEEINVRLSAVLRSASFGTYQIQLESMTLHAVTEACIFCVSAEDLMLLLQNDYGFVPADQYMLEVYLDGKYLGGAAFSVKDQ